MNRWLLGLSVATIVGGLLELLKVLVPFGAVFFAFFGLRLGMQFQAVVVTILGFLGLTALIERLSSLNRIEKGIQSINSTHMPRIEKAIESVALTNVAFQLGIAGITSNWTNFIKFHQPFGDRLEQQLKDSEVATWYIVSTSPLGLLDWKSYFIDAVENKKIDIKWVYHPSDILKTSPAIKAQALMLFGYEPDWQVREQTVEMEWGNAVERLKLMVSQSESNIRLGSKTSAGSWELYESTLPHFFFAFLSVPKKKQGLPSDAFVPNGTFGFVHLYPDR